MTQWQAIARTSDPVEAQLWQTKLASEGLQAVVVNKKDSNYHFGVVELHVPQDQVLQALTLIRNERTED